LELIDGLSKLVLSASTAQYKACPVDFEVRKAAQEGKWCWWRPGHSGFPLQAYQALQALWGGQLSFASLNGSNWQDSAASGYGAVLAADWLVQQELGRFGHVDEIERFAPRMMQCASKNYSLYSWVWHGFHDSGKGKAHPCQHSTAGEAHVRTVISELRNSKEHRDLLKSAESAQVSSSTALQTFCEFVWRNLGCAVRTQPLSSCAELHLLKMQGLARLWNREGSLRGQERSSAKFKHGKPGDLQPIRMVVAIYANNRPRYLEQVL
jgi:hypothetical protein